MASKTVHGSRSGFSLLRPGAGIHTWMDVSASHNHKCAQCPDNLLIQILAEICNHHSESIDSCYSSDKAMAGG